jgi:hypothetical protein
MSASKSSSPILNLKAGVEIFPVKKTILVKNLGLFRDSPSLLDADVYEIQSRVPLPVHAMFVNIVEGGPIILSDESCESFRLLAEEFQFEPLLVECASFMISRRRRSWFDSSRKTGLCNGESGEECQHSGRPRVTLTVNRYSRTFESLNSLDETKHFAICLQEATEDGIVIEGIEGRDRLVEKAVSTIYSNTVASLADDDRKRNHLVLVLWVIHKRVSSCSIDAAIYCLNQLNEIAPTSFEKARVLLFSQLEPRCPDEFVLVPNPDCSVIRDATHMLRFEKNGKREEANALLLKLKEAGSYQLQLEDWTPDDPWPESPGE